MKFLIRFSLWSILALPVSSFATNAVVNMSHYDLMRVDFTRMKSEGIVGVIHEASYPRFERDSYYAARQQQATRAGLLWGAYHFANANDPVRQADHFLNIVTSSWMRADPSTRPSGILLVLDFEKNGHYPGGTMRVDQMVTFVERIRERTGKYPGIYSGENHMRQAMSSGRVTAAQKRVLANCWLWLANYGARPSTILPWGHWLLWQYTGDGKCRLPRAGYPKSVANIAKAERNIFNGSRMNLEHFWSDRSWHPGSSNAGTAAPHQPFTAER